MIFNTNIEKATIENDNYRKVIYTDKLMQLVLMSLQPNENIPREKHSTIDQFIRIESGSCIVNESDENKNIINTITLNKDDAIIIPSNTWHEVINGNSILKLYSIYTPSQHKAGLIQKFASDEKNHEQHGGYLSKYLKYKNKIINHIIKNNNQ